MKLGYGKKSEDIPIGAIIYLVYVFCYCRKSVIYSQKSLRIICNTSESPVCNITFPDLKYTIYLLPCDLLLAAANNFFGVRPTSFLAL